MEKAYKILYSGGEAEITEKKSRFLTKTMPVNSEEEANIFIESVRKTHWDAAHNCFAFVIGKNQELARCSDDGEPSKTAGRPMLDVLLGEDIHNIAVVVTRYFGGTLLGTGGLVRAYSRAVQDGLKNSIILEKRSGWCLKITSDYSAVGKIQYICAQAGGYILETAYTEIVIFHILVPCQKEIKLEKELNEAFNGRLIIKRTSEVSYGILDNQVIFL